jgi:hypothetical protein
LEQAGAAESALGKSLREQESSRLSFAAGMAESMIAIPESMAGAAGWL